MNVMTKESIVRITELFRFAVLLGSAYLAVQLAAIVAIIYGQASELNAFVLGAALGALTMWTIFFFLLYRPLQKSWIHLDKLLGNAMRQHARLLEELQQRPKDISGDRWKDN